MKIKKKIPGHVVMFFVLLFCVSGICLLLYKTSFRYQLHQPVKYTMMTTHKATNTISLSKDAPLLTETFICTVPDFSQFTLSGKAQNKSSDARLAITLTDADSGEVIYAKEKKLSNLKSSKAKSITCNLSEPIKDSKGKSLQLRIELLNPGKTTVSFTANEKQALIQEFNSDPASHTNVIYSFTYGDNTFMHYFYIAICIALLLFAALAYYLIIVRSLTIQHFFIPTAIFLGLIFQVMITVNGVPDEPTHFDAAYKYSNKMLFVKETGTPNTIYKRRCDIELSDMLSNGLESNSYYQLVFHTLEKAVDTELIPVSYTDASTMVPGIVYIPAAIGISIGRLLTLSPMLTMQLGRICALIAFVLLVYLAICIAPFGKNLLGALAFLPITLQQAASASYDSITIGFIFLYTALCFYLLSDKPRKKSHYILLGLLSLFIAATKGGVYLPLLLLLPISLHRKSTGLRKKLKLIIPLFIIGIVLVILTLIKFMPLFSAMFATDAADSPNALYSISFVLHNPLQTVYILVNTVLQRGDTLLNGLLGGALSWQDVKINWFLLAALLVVVLLLANVKNDSAVYARRNYAVISISCLCSILLIMFSMLVGFTTMKWDYIQGLQGRYLIPIAPALFSLFSTPMVNVDEKHYGRVWMSMIVLEILVLLQVAMKVL